MSDTAFADLFPLPLVPFERYMLADERPAYPMTGYIELEFSGEFERGAFEGAVEEIVPRHPLYCAQIERLPKQGLCWVAAGDFMPRLDWSDLDAPRECPGDGAIDLAKETGLRLWVRQGGGRARLTVQLHHACADAVGTFQLLGDLLAAHAERTGGHQAVREAVALDPAALRHRGQFDVKLPEPVSGWQIARSAVTEGVKFLGRRPMPLEPLARPAGEAVPAAPFPGIGMYTFDAARTAALREAAKTHRATLNDVLLRDAFQTMLAWNARHDGPPRGRWLRINMPTNLRGRKDYRTPAANIMSYAFLTRQLDECRDPEALLAGIRQETDAIRNWSLGLLFLDGLGFTLKVPGLLRLVTGPRRCLASLVVSNVGDAAWHFRAKFPKIDGRLRAGHLTLERATGAPPVRPMTRATVVVSRHAGELTLGVRCDPRLFSWADTEALLAQYVGRLEQTIAEGR